jgi:type II secretion system protein N
VQKFRRFVLILVGALLALASVILLGVNLYVQSQETQRRIQQELSQRLGTPLTIRRISVTPWGGLVLNGLAIPQVSAHGSGDFLDAKTFRLRVRFLSLFSKRLVIKEISLVGPRVIWPQDSDGKWRLPGSRPPENSATANEGALAEAPETKVEPGQSASPANTLETSPSRELTEEQPATQFVPEIRRIKVSGGNFRFLDQSGNFVAAFEGVQFRSNFRNSMTLDGTASVSKISLRDRFFLEQMRSTLRYDPAQLDLPQMSAHAGGGDLSGRFTMEPQSEDSPFSVAIKFRNVQADRIIADAGGQTGMVQGRLEGSFEATGKVTDPTALRGSGEILLRDGQLRQYSLLVALGQILQIEELTQLHLDQADGKYHIESGVVTIDELILRSPNTRLSAKGTIAFDGRLQLDSQLAINDKIRGQLFKPIRANFQPTSDPDYFAVDFHVSGTIDRPKSNLVEKVVGRDLKDFGSVINSFLGGGKSSKKQKPSDTPAPSPTGSPPPSP